jgi:hypothetical protein
MPSFVNSSSSENYYPGLPHPPRPRPACPNPRPNEPHPPRHIFQHARRALMGDSPCREDGGEAVRPAWNEDELG